jgi:hypothetical protein
MQNKYISTGRIQTKFSTRKRLEYFTQIDLWGIPRRSRDIQDFLDMKYRIFGRAVSKIHDCFGLCNVMTALDPSFDRKQLNEKYEIYRQTIKSNTLIIFYIM